jgi:ABC-type protease/lipase transport system fused ATPase/permease subunit
VRFLGHQVGILGQATARLGLVVAERLDRMEAEQSAERAVMAAEIAALSGRVAELEARP